MKLREIGAKNDMPKNYTIESIVNKKIHQMWKHILERCNVKEDDRIYSYYKDCTYHEDFLLLSNFVKWIEQEPRYTEFCNTCDSISWSIDKDGIIPGNKEYAPGKIRLIPLSENIKERNQRCGIPLVNNPYSKAKGVIGVSIDGNINKFYRSAKDTQCDGFSPGNVTNCCKGHRKTHKGYKWFYATDLLGVMNYLYII